MMSRETYTYIIYTNVKRVEAGATTLFFDPEKGVKISHFAVISLLVGMTGFEPATTRPPDAYSTGLSYIPKILIISHLYSKISLTFETSKRYILPTSHHCQTRPPEVKRGCLRWENV